MMDFSRSPLILVADDNPTNRHAMEVLLADQNMDVHFAEDGIAAYDEAVSLQPDLILLDVMMPERDGFEVCRMLRAHPDLREVPIVLVTALDDRASRLQGIEAGADDFISKPVDMLELLARVKTIVRLNRYKSLQKERAQFKWAVEQAGEGYLLLDQQEIILYANPQARSYLGLTRDKELSNQANFLEITEKQFTRYPDYLWDNWREPSKQTRYLMIPESTKNRAFWLEVDVFPGPENDPILVVSLRNVSAAMNADQDFKKFHYLISHKLNTPLNGVYGLLELMNSSVEEMPFEKMKEMSQLALASATRLRSDVEDILNYLRASSAAPRGESLKLVQVAAVASEISKELKIQPAVVRVAAAAHNHSMIFSKLTFELILMELFENSKKFHPAHDPKMKIVISKIDDEQVSVKVIDDGLHLSVEQRAALVEPYKQLEGMPMEEEAGFGLGIPMVVSILQTVGGSLSVYNSSDAPGLTVELLVPAMETPEY